MPKIPRVKNWHDYDRHAHQRAFRRLQAFLRHGQICEGSNLAAIGYCDLHAGLGHGVLGPDRHGQMHYSTELTFVYFNYGNSFDITAAGPPPRVIKGELHSRLYQWFTECVEKMRAQAVALETCGVMEVQRDG